MPIYEYECSQCKNIEEKYFKKPNHTIEIRCIKCNAKAKRIVERTTFQLNGNCWAKDGYTK